MPSIRETGKLFSESPTKMPAHYLIAHSDGGARGNPGPAGYGVVIHDEGGRKIAALSQYLGHHANNVAEYQGLIAALEDTIQHAHTAAVDDIAHPADAWPWTIFQPAQNLRKSSVNSPCGVLSSFIVSFHSPRTKAASGASGVISRSENRSCPISWPSL